jgi:methanogenic corrinoid protein MtbC1
MSNVTKRTQLISAIAGLDEEKSLILVRERLSKHDNPELILADCQDGMLQVGERYMQHQYYLSGLIMGGEIFCEVMELVRPVVLSHTQGSGSGKVLLGTVAGDIHDLGKNIVSMLLTCHKFTVHDAGVDVPPQEFVRKAKEIQPGVIGLSGLITSAYDSMKETISILHRNGCKAPIIIGGGQLDEEVFRYTGADYWVKDANAGVELFKKLLKKPSSISS